MRCFSPSSRTKKKKVYVIKTDKRPVPLEHYLYYNKELYKIVDSKKQFLHNGYAIISIKSLNSRRL